MYAEAGCVTALAKESDVLVQAVEAHAVLFVSHEFNLHCSQPIESTTFHMYSRNPVSYSSFCFVYSQKPVCLNKCYFKYIRTCFFSDIYCSSQKPSKSTIFLPSFVVSFEVNGLCIAMDVSEYILLGVQDTKQS